MVPVDLTKKWRSIRYPHTPGPSLQVYYLEEDAPPIVVVICADHVVKGAQHVPITRDKPTLRPSGDPHRWWEPNHQSPWWIQGDPHGPRWVSTSSRPGVAGHRGGDAWGRGVLREVGAQGAGSAVRPCMVGPCLWDRVCFVFEIWFLIQSRIAAVTLMIV
jgi:hypothetical protein